jgi:hypothetical protein
MEGLCPVWVYNVPITTLFNKVKNPVKYTEISTENNFKTKEIARLVFYLHACCVLVEWAWLLRVASVIWSSGVHYSFHFTIHYLKIVLTVPS